MNSETLADTAFIHIKHDILQAKMAPGSKINIESLKKQYGIGLTPLREALSRLVSLGWVEFKGLKGFSVTPLSLEALKDIYQVRELIETEALKLALDQGDAQWESEVLASYHRLHRLETDKKFSENPDIIEWMKKYREFHFALLDGCKSPWFLKLDTQLFEQSERYRYLRLTAVTDFKKFIAQKAKAHEQLIKYILAREKKYALKLFIAQLSATVEDLAAQNKT